MRSAYRALLRLYPPEYRRRFADEMAAVFAEAAEDSRQRGWFAHLRFVLSEYAGLLIGAFRERDFGRSLAPVLGGAALAALLNFAFYAAVHRVLQAAAAALQHSSIPASDPLAEAITVGVFGLASVLPLLPLFLLLTIRMTWRSR